MKDLYLIIQQTNQSKDHLSLRSTLFCYNYIDLTCIKLDLYWYEEENITYFEMLLLQLILIMQMNYTPVKGSWLINLKNWDYRIDESTTAGEQLLSTRTPTVTWSNARSENKRSINQSELCGLVKLNFLFIKQTNKQNNPSIFIIFVIMFHYRLININRRLHPEIASLNWQVSCPPLPSSC